MTDRLIILCVWAAVAFLGLGERALWDPLEGRYAAITLVMVESGDWLVPQYEGEAYDQKPPLGFWLAGLGLKVFGHDSRLALRLPSCLALLGAMLVLRGLGARLHGPRAGLFAALFLGTSWLAFWSARWFLLDTLVLFGLLLVIDGALRHGNRGARTTGLAEVILGGVIGLLAKGPVGLVFALAIFGASALFGARLEVRGWLRLGVGMFVAVAIAAAWYVPARSAAGTAWGQALLFGQGVSRHIEVHDDRHGGFYYWRALWLVAAPWSVLLPFAIWSAVRARTRLATHALSLGWVVAVLALLFLVPVQRDRYLMPVLPGLCLFLGAWVATVCASGHHPLRRAHRGLLLFATALPVLAMIVAGSVLLAPSQLAPTFGDIPTRARGFAYLVEATPLRWIAALVFAALAATATRCYRRGALRAAMLNVVALVAVVGSAWGLIAAPAADAGRDDARMIALVREHLKPEDRFLLIGGYGYRESTWGWFRWHFGRDIERLKVPPEDPRTLEDGRPTLVVTREKVLRYAPQMQHTGWIDLSGGPITRELFRVYRIPARQ